ncbi:MAG: NAD-dependent protein deacylase, partial [Clostridia bacterium]|nr:NAD-dependent protein deacylase [Clostridia bacterium]
MNREDLQKLNEYISEGNVVFFGGAGTSTESGIPDFRSQDGLYHLEYDLPPEQIISHSYYKANPA